MAKPLTTDELRASLRRDIEESCREHMRQIIKRLPGLDVSKRKNKSTEKVEVEKKEEFNMMVNL